MAKTITIDASDSELEAALVAARAMLAALYEIARANVAGEENPERLLKAWRQVNDAIIAAEAAGITTTREVTAAEYADLRKREA